MSILKSILFVSGLKADVTDGPPIEVTIPIDDPFLTTTTTTITGDTTTFSTEFINTTDASIETNAMTENNENNQETYYPEDTPYEKAFFDWENWTSIEACYYEFVELEDKEAYEECCKLNSNSRNCLHYKNALNIPPNELIPDGAVPVDFCWYTVTSGSEAINSGLLGFYPTEDWARCCYEMCSYYNWECPETHFCRPLIYVDTSDYWYLWLSLAGIVVLAIIIIASYFLCSCCAVNGMVASSQKNGPTSNTQREKKNVRVVRRIHCVEDCATAPLKTARTNNNDVVDNVLQENHSAATFPIDESPTSINYSAYKTFSDRPAYKTFSDRLSSFDDSSVVLAPVAPIPCPFDTV